MDVFKEGAWVELTANYYYSYRLRKGMVGFVDGIERYKIGFRPTYHPDGNPIDTNLRWVNKGDMELLPIQLSEEDLYDLINLALSDKDETAFNELVNRWEYMMYLIKGKPVKNTK